MFTPHRAPTGALAEPGCGGNVVLVRIPRRHLGLHALRRVSSVEPRKSDPTRASGTYSEYHCGSGRATSPPRTSSDRTGMRAATHRLWGRRAGRTATAGGTTMARRLRLWSGLIL